MKSIKVLIIGLLIGTAACTPQQTQAFTLPTLAGLVTAASGLLWGNSAVSQAPMTSDDSQVATTVAKATLTSLAGLILAAYGCS
jgi:hypothetical protein